METLSSLASPLEQVKSNAANGKPSMSFSLSSDAPPSPPRSPPPSLLSSSHALSTARSRLQSLLSSSQWLGVTTARQRQRLPKDLLIQRNLEIQAQQLLIDEEYDSLLDSSTSPPSSAASLSALLAALDRESDELAEESDEIETRLYEKYHLRGGGRMLIVDEMEEARAIGERLARDMRGGITGDRPRGGGPRASEEQKQPEREELKEEVKQEEAEQVMDVAPPEEKAERGEETEARIRPMDEDDAVSTGVTRPSAAMSRAKGGKGRGRTRGKRVSQSHQAVLERLHAQADANENARKERAEVNKEGLLGRLYAFFDEYVDVDGDVGPARPELTEEQREARRRQMAERRKAAVRSFPFVLGTLTFPLFLVSDDLEHGSSASHEVVEEDGRSVSLDFITEPPVPGEDGCVVRRTRTRADGGEDGAIIGFLPFPFHWTPLPTSSSSSPFTFLSATSPYPLPFHPLLALHLLLRGDVVSVESSTSISGGRRAVDVTVFLHDKFLQRTRLRTNLQRAAMLSLFRLFPAAQPEDDGEVAVVDTQSDRAEGEEAIEGVEEVSEPMIEESKEPVIDGDEERKSGGEDADVFSAIAERRKLRALDQSTVSNPLLLLLSLSLTHLSRPRPQSPL